MTDRERIERLEYAVLLLAKHIGGTGWDGPLQEVLDSIEYEPSDPPPERQTLKP